MKTENLFLGPKAGRSMTCLRNLRKGIMADANRE